MFRSRRRTADRAEFLEKARIADLQPEDLHVALLLATAAPPAGDPFAPPDVVELHTRDLLLEEEVELVRFEEAERATHRDLAAGLVAMERYDDALAELEVAIAADPFSEGACLALAGRCHLVRGATRDAVDAYRRALASTTLSFEAACAVHYELAAALEAWGAHTDSLAHRREAARLEPDYREVSDRIAKLFTPARRG